MRIAFAPCMFNLIQPRQQVWGLTANTCFAPKPPSNPERHR